MSVAAANVAAEVAILIQAAKSKSGGSYDYLDVVEAVTNNTNQVTLVGSYNAQQLDYSFC